LFVFARVRGFFFWLVLSGLFLFLVVYLGGVPPGGTPPTTADGMARTV
jgi:hypothetical protein